jgi:hypothetical protein
MPQNAGSRRDRTMTRYLRAEPARNALTRAVTASKADSAGRYWGRRRWACTAVQPGAFTLRLMCRAEVVWFCDQDLSVEDSVIDGTTDRSGRPEDLPGAGHLGTVRGHGNHRSPELGAVCRRSASRFGLQMAVPREVLEPGSFIGADRERPLTSRSGWSAASSTSSFSEGRG